MTLPDDTDPKARLDATLAKTFPTRDPVTITASPKQMKLANPGFWTPGTKLPPAGLDLATNV